MYQYALHNYEAEGYFAECQIAAKPWVHLALLLNQWNNEHVKYFKNINMINCVRHDEDQDVRATQCLISCCFATQWHSRNIAGVHGSVSFTVSDSG